MKSTIRFNEAADTYQCRNLNFVNVNESSEVEVDSSNNVLGLAVRDNARLDLEVSNNDEAFELLIDDLAFYSEYSQYTPKKVSGYLTFGYAHNAHGLPFVIDPDSTPRQLVITKNAAHTVTVVFDGNIVGMQTGVYGPIRQLMLVDNIDGMSDCKFILNNIVYETLTGI